MLNHFVTTFSALLFICVLSPILMVIASFIIVRVGLVDPVLHVYRFFRADALDEPFEPV